MTVRFLYFPLASMRPLLLLAFLLPTAVAAQEAGPVTFAIDMRPAANAGWFDAAAATVGLRGDAAPLAWDETFALADPDGDLVYTGTVPFAAPGDVAAYKVKVDGLDAAPNGGWEPDPNRMVLVTASAQTVARAWAEGAPEAETFWSGTVERIEGVDAAALGLAGRDVLVYLPPGYADAEQAGARYPVLYLHDGQNVFDPASAGAEWGADEAAEELIAAGAVRPMIIVGVASTGARLHDYTPTATDFPMRARRLAPGPFDAADPVGSYAGRYRTDEIGEVTIAPAGDALRIVWTDDSGTAQARAEPDGAGGYVFDGQGQPATVRFQVEDGAVVGADFRRRAQGGGAARYGRFLTEHVKPLIDRRYRTLPDAAHTALGGSSLGGLVTLHLGLAYPDVFGQLLVVSPSAWWDDGVLVREVRALAEKTGQRVWLDVGTDNDGLEDAERLRAALVQKGWAEGDDLAWTVADGARHNERAWAARFPAMLRFLDAGWTD